MRTEFLQIPKPIGFSSQAHCLALFAALLGFFIGNTVMKEIWKDIPNFEGIYKVSNKGRVHSFAHYKKGIIMSNVNKTGGYFATTLRFQGKIRHVRVHVLVAEAFVPNPDNKPEVNHKDLNKQNNCIWNLEWVTRQENVVHSIKNNPSHTKGMNNYNQNVRPKTILQVSFDGQIVNEFKNSTEAESFTGVCHRNILQVASQDEYKPGKTRKQAGGFIWRYKN